VMTFADKGLPGRRRHHPHPAQAPPSAAGAVAQPQRRQSFPRRGSSAR
jgi:hypothetical protein